MRGIRIQFYVDNHEWEETRFEDEKMRTVEISGEELKRIMRSKGVLTSNEFVHEEEDVRFI